MYRRLHLERLKLAQRLGRRGLLLILWGLTWTLIGITSIAIPQDRFSSPGIGPDTILQLLDGREFSLMWVIAGGIAFTVGVLHDRRIINKHEAMGWNAVLTMPLIWMIFFAWSFASWVWTDGESGRSNSLYGFFVWTIISLVIMIIAGWPEEKFETSLFRVRTGETSESPEETDDSFEKE